MGNETKEETIRCIVKLPAEKEKIVKETMSLGFNEFISNCFAEVKLGITDEGYVDRNTMHLCLQQGKHNSPWREEYLITFVENTTQNAWYGIFITVLKDLTGDYFWYDFYKYGKSGKHSRKMCSYNNLNETINFINSNTKGKIKTWKQLQV